MRLEVIYSGDPICCDGIPNTLSTNNSSNPPWLVAHNLADDGIVNFYSMDEQPSNYKCRIPELKGMHFLGLSHGWMILSNPPHEVMWSLWNPVTSTLIRLPPLQGSEDKIALWCLSSPPGDPTSILLLTRYEKPIFVFCRIHSVKRKRSRSRWTEMSYAKQLTKLMGGEEGGILDGLTCCNGKVFALSHDTSYVLLIDIKVFKDKQVVISLLPFQKYPYPYIHHFPAFYELKGFGTELFVITGRVDAPAGVYLFKLDMTTTHDDGDEAAWEEIHDLKDAVFFVDLRNYQQVSYIPAAASGLGGFVHIRADFRMIINSFHVKDKILSVLPMPWLFIATHISIWEYRGFEADNNDREVKCTDDDKQEEAEEEDKENDDQIIVVTRSSHTKEDDDESRLLDVPFHVLETIMEHCVGIEYMNFRATCKRCHLAAPRTHWRDKTSLRKLEKYSLVSPWLMVVDQVNKGIMNITEPISGDKYFMTSDLYLSYDDLYSISCSKYGWLLFYTRSSGLGYHHLVFFNPFTNDIRKLPPTPPHFLENICFSAPPTSTNCIVVGFSTKARAAYILRYGAQLLWRRYDVDYSGGGYAFCFPTFHGRDLYALCNEGRLVVFKGMSEGRFSQPEVVAAEPPLIHDPWMYPPQRCLMIRGQCLLIVIWGKVGGDPKLLQFSDSTKEWSQIESLERDVVFLGGATCVCIEEANPKMQNKIYFSRFKDEKLIFYSLETSQFHTFDGKLATRQEAFQFCFLRSSVHLSLNAWIEPSWY